MATRKRALRGPEPSAVEKWDVVSWNNQVNLSKEPSSCHLSGSSSIPDSTSTQETGTLFTSPQPHSAPANNPCFATTASAFGFDTASARPRAIPRRKSSHGPVPDAHQNRLDALSALHRSVEEHHVDFVARMRELEERCHLLPDSLSVLRSADLTASGASRGRKRGIASWDDDGDVEMSCWSERRRKHRSLRSDSPALGSAASASGEKPSHASDDGYLITDHDGVDSSSCSDDDEDDDLDIVIVPSGSSSASTPPSLSTSLWSLPARPGSPHLHHYTPSPIIPGPKGVDELAAAIAGGAGSVVQWSVSSDVPGDESHLINPDITQAGALWA